MRLFILPAMLGLMVCGISSASADWALAVGQEGQDGYSYGTAYNYTSTSEAHSAALQQCRSQGRNCEVVADGAGSCVAAAFSTVNNGYGWASRDDKRSASRAALKKCHDFADTQCEVRASFCDE